MTHVNDRKRRLLERLLVVGGYLLFLLVVAEVGLQAFYRVINGGFLFRRHALAIYVPDPHSVWAVEPNLRLKHQTPEYTVELHTNSQGYRVSVAHEEYQPGRNPTRYRIVLLGSSFAFGWGVNHQESFAARLQRRLAEAGFAAGRRVEVINRGVPSLPPANNLNWLKSVGREYEPDLVIQFAYGSMATPSRPQALAVRNGYLVDPEATIVTRAKSLSKSSAIVFYSWTLSSMLRARNEPRSIAGTGRDVTLMTHFDPGAAQVGDAVALYDDLRAAARSMGARVLVVYFPAAFAVHLEDTARWRHLGVRDGDAEKQLAFDRAFMAYLEARGVACMDVTQALWDEAAKGQGRLYYWLDVHWTPAGNAVVAKSVSEFLLADRRWALALERAGAQSLLPRSLTD